MCKTGGGDGYTFKIIFDLSQFPKKLQMCSVVNIYLFSSILLFNGKSSRRTGSDLSTGTTGSRECVHVREFSAFSKLGRSCPSAQQRHL